MYWLFLGVHNLLLKKTLPPPTKMVKNSVSCEALKKNPANIEKQTFKKISAESI